MQRRSPQGHDRRTADHQGGRARGDRTAELLVALAGEEYISGRALARLGLSPQAVSAAADRAVEPGSVAHLTHRPLAGDAKKAILSARKEADRLKTNIGTEHLLLGVLRERKSDGRRILKELGVTYDAVRDAVAVERSLPRPPHAFS
jgi:ATP-dependent Clp protease ATP-binding subunit ClpA